MKKLISLTAIGFTLFQSSILRADPPSRCDDPHSHLVTKQCIYLTGLNDQDHQRWIRIQTDFITYTRCFGSIEQQKQYELMFVPSPVESTDRVPLNIRVSICNSKYAPESACKTLATYQSQCNAQTNSCKPAGDQAINIADIKNQFTTCNDSNKDSHRNYFHKRK